MVSRGVLHDPRKSVMVSRINCTTKNVTNNNNNNSDISQFYSKYTVTVESYFEFLIHI